MVKSHEMERSHEISRQYMPMLPLLAQVLSAILNAQFCTRRILILTLLGGVSGGEIFRSKNLTEIYSLSFGCYPKLKVMLKGKFIAIPLNQ